MPAGGDRGEPVLRLVQGVHGGREEAAGRGHRASGVVGRGEGPAPGDGRVYFDADLLRRKEIFAAHLVRNVPLAAHIRRVLEERHTHMAPRARFHAELEDFLDADESERVLDAVIAWGRFAELFEYDLDRAEFILERT